ncbi:MAG: fibronectin type III domain-containing protein [Syntrophaceae bacterium]|nr:fibronectin type III domain-containing protein [Syntrophaceae bacterium]
MKRIYVTLIIVLLPLCSEIYAAEPINPSTDLIYLGAFKLPDLPEGFVWPVFDGAGYNKGGMTYFPKNNSLLVMGGPGNTVTTRRYLAEINIPTLKIDTYENLDSGLLLHDLVDIIGKDNSGTYAHLGDVHFFPKQGTQSTDKLYISIYGSYVTPSIYSLFNGQYAWAETDLDNMNVKGWWRFDIGSQFVGKYIFHIPYTWADQNVDGKYLITGYYRGGGGATLGPTLYAFAPWESCEGSCDSDPPPDAEDGAEPEAHISDPIPPELKHTLPYQTLLQYSGEAGDQTFKDASPNDKFSSGAWVTLEDKSAVVLFGWKAMRSWEEHKYSYPNAPAFIKSVNEGYHDEPGFPALFFYNVDDFSAVARGIKAPYEPQPYAVVNLLPYFYYKDGLSSSVDGMAYDETNGILYLRESSKGYEAIHGFHLSNPGNSFDALPPSKPVLNLVFASHENVTFSWEECTDNSNKPVIYEIWRNGAPIAVTTSTSFNDEYYEYYISPVVYYVKAKDLNGNEAVSDPIHISNQQGGNAPLTIFTPILGGTEHETSSALLTKKNTDYSFTPIAIGGIPPYTWSATGLPTGLEIDEFTGAVTGNVGNLSTGPYYTPAITVIDSYGNIHRRRTKFKIVPETATDLDGDGFNSIADGGGDIDDTTIMINPLNPSQPPPTGFRIIGLKDNSILLNWNAAEQRKHIAWNATFKEESDWQKFQGDITYRIHYGTSPGNYTHSAYVGRSTYLILNGSSAGTYYFAVSAFSFRGLESDKSNEVAINFKEGSGEFELIPSGYPYPTSLLNGQGYGSYFVEGQDNENAIVTTGDGGVALASFTSSYAWSEPPIDFIDERDNKAIKRMMLVKTDADGFEQWRRIIGPEGYNITEKQIGSDVHWTATGIINTDADNLIVTGYRGTSESSPGGFTGIDGFMMKFDSDGNILWDRAVNGIGTSNDFLTDVAERPGGGFAAAGHSNRAGDTDVWLVLTDANGQNHNQHSYNTNGKGYEAARALRKTSDGGYVIAGYTQTGQESDEDYYVVKTDANGVLEWAERLDNQGRRDKAYSVEEDNSGNIWLFGRSNKPGLENTKIWIVKYSAQGDYQASYEIGDDVDANAYIARGSIKLENGNFLVIGYTNVSNNQGYNGYIVEINTSGEIVGAPKIVGADTSYSEDYLFSGVVSKDSQNYLLAGSNNGAFSTGYDLWFLKISSSDKSVQNYTNCSSWNNFYYDKDLDGWGNNNQWSDPLGRACYQMPGYVLNHKDTDDTLVVDPPEVELVTEP